MRSNNFNTRASYEKCHTLRFNMQLLFQQQKDNDQQAKKITLI